LKRIDAWRLREELRQHPLAPLRLSHCGALRYQRSVQLLTAGGATAWWQGVVCCRARVCPPCFVARRFQQALEIEHTVRERERETQKQSFLATLTVRHQSADPVSLTRKVRVAWRDLLQSRAWRVFTKDYGLEWIVAEEVTRGDNGWHPHMHALLMPRKAIDLQNVWTSLAPHMHDWWCRSVKRKIGAEHEPSREHGCDLRPCDSAEYLAKLGLELADPAMVKGRSPLALLAAGERDQYMELQMSRSRARDITFSRGLGGIRESMPEGEPPAELLEIAGSDWGLMRHRGWDKPLEVAEAAKDPESAAVALEVALGRRRKPPADCA
jgi:hypothetical protein